MSAQVGYFANALAPELERLRALARDIFAVGSTPMSDADRDAFFARTMPEVERQAIGAQKAAAMFSRLTAQGHPVEKLEGLVNEFAREAAAMQAAVDEMRKPAQRPEGKLS